MQRRYFYALLACLIFITNSQPLSYLTFRDITDFNWKLHSINGFLGFIDFGPDGSFNPINTKFSVTRLLTTILEDAQKRLLLIDTTNLPAGDIYVNATYTGAGLNDGLNTTISNPNPNPPIYTWQPFQLTDVTNFMFNSTDNTMVLMAGSTGIVKFYYSMRDFYGKWFIYGRQLGGPFGNRIYLEQLL